ncbi:hypothetical protein C5167_051201 [Papaver somniferum]|uniref:Uncharacterized protein n=1 Tax=Papaver somniferum TaxID=3469 RepID=A0A4Y7KTM6_PAPSO|nr:hypothetical protein C5167_051201 [Papaver somniferum]
MSERALSMRGKTTQATEEGVGGGVGNEEERMVAPFIEIGMSGGMDNEGFIIGIGRVCADI